MHIRDVQFANIYNTQPKGVVNMPSFRESLANWQASSNPIQAQTQVYPLNVNKPVQYTKLGVQKTPFGDEVNLYKLSNGQKVGILKKPGTTIVKTFVNCGSMNETDRIRGISHFIEHNLFNGSKNLEPGEVFKTVSDLGADANASTSFSLTDYYLSMSSIDESELEKFIKMQSDMVNNPLFRDDMIEKEKGPVTSEISMMNDDIQTRAYQKVLKNLFQIQTDDKDDLIGGSLNTINALTRADVVDYWSKYYTPDNMCTVVVGDVDPDKTIELIAQNFTKAPVNNPEVNRFYTPMKPSNTPKRVDYISPTDNGSTIIASFAAPDPQNAKDEIAIQAVSTLLAGYDTSRLTQSLRTIKN